MDYVYRRNLTPDPRFRNVESMVAKDVTVKTVDHENGRRYVRAVYDRVGTDPYLNIYTRETGVGGIRPSPVAAHAVRRSFWGLAA